jgi:hypothetical protein
MLIAANWDLSGTSRVFDATGGWTAEPVGRRSPIACFLRT